MQANQRYRLVKRSLLLCAATNFFLGTFKIIFGLMFGSLSVLADGLHSWADLLGDAFVISVSKYAHEPPDDAFSYGHMRIETLATVVFSFIIILIGLGIGVETLFLWKRGELPKPETGLWMVPLVSVIGNELMYQYVRRQAVMTHSDLLSTAALHQRLDAMTSSVVLASMLAFFSGIHFADAIGAFIISVFIIKHASPLCYRSIMELIDRGAPVEILDRVHDAISKTAGVIDHHKLRTRMMAKHLLVDVHIDCASTVSVSEGHYIAEKVVESIKKKVPTVLDVQVHVDPHVDADIDSVTGFKMNRDVIEKKLHRFIPKGLVKIHLHYFPDGIEVEIYTDHDAVIDSRSLELFLSHCAEIRNVTHFRKQNQWLDE